MTHKHGLGNKGLARELTPSSSLRLGIVLAPTPSALFAVRDEATGSYVGVTVDLGGALAQQLVGHLPWNVV
jgi:polar amino acid transport system substrate-binding protein